MSSTIIRLTSSNKCAFNLKISAIDGSLHEINSDEGTISFVISGAANFTLNQGRLNYLNSIIETRICNSKGEEIMRELEYKLANEINADIIFMDRKFSMDKKLGMKIPKNSIGIVKDFNREEVNINEEPPWITINKEEDFYTGYYKITSWVFRYETNLDNLELLQCLIYNLSQEPIPEALGYNYPLFLADKLVKYYRDKYAKVLDFTNNKELSRYRDFRRIVEHVRGFV
ncbi:DNA double-strand break repair nuclease NurA [Acidianus sp.]|uniref:DNA double-strand break repair nuclease NurA n=1 Tax=Acidianus sp. TaxID=1872104 RepID=UPI003978C783